MSLHGSLKTKNKLVRRRNVLKRVERIQQLRQSGYWEERKHSVFGLPKIFIEPGSGLVRVKEHLKDEVPLLGGKKFE